MALPNYDAGVSLNMTLRLSRQPAAFDREQFPEMVWMSNLFGRATQNLVLNDELRRAYEIVDRELRHVATIQRSLLPRDLPRIPHLELAAHYQTSRWAGGDYYDFFPLPDDQWGLLIADVSGHGTPAAVMMAITHSLAHGYPGHPMPPAELLAHVNHRLARALHGRQRHVRHRLLRHLRPPTPRPDLRHRRPQPPRVKRCRDHRIDVLDRVGGLPLGLFDDIAFDQAAVTLEPGDQLVLYTDGITEAADSEGRMFGVERLDRPSASCEETADALIRTSSTRSPASPPTSPPPTTEPCSSAASRELLTSAAPAGGRGRRSTLRAP